jgi:hypothetical protein
MATSNKSLNNVFPDDQLEVGKILVMSPNHGIPLQNVERLTRSTITELDFSTNSRDVFLEYVVENSLAAVDQHSFNGYEIYIAKGEKTCSDFLRTAEPEKFIAAFELDANELKRLHNASISYKYINTARSAMIRAKTAHNELVTLSKKSKALQSFATRTTALNAASHSYGVQTLKKLKRDIKKHMSKTW